MQYVKALCVLVAAVVIVSCSTVVEPSPILAALQTEFKLTSEKPFVKKYAQVELEQAEEAIDKLAALERTSADPDRLAHAEYIARKKLDIAITTAQVKQAEAQMDGTCLAQDACGAM